LTATDVPPGKSTSVRTRISAEALYRENPRVEHLKLKA
jgi:hypothetical protein